MIIVVRKHACICEMSSIDMKDNVILSSLYVHALVILHVYVLDNLQVHVLDRLHVKECIRCLI